MNNRSRTDALLVLLATSWPAFADTTRLEAGKVAYEAYCAKCHETGLMSAPVTGTAEVWAHRSKPWHAMLAEHAESGYLQMPTGGSAEEAGSFDVEVATEYMLTLSNPGIGRQGSGR
jgi:cytochrome c5